MASSFKSDAVMREKKEGRDEASSEGMDSSFPAAAAGVLKDGDRVVPAKRLSAVSSEATLDLRRRPPRMTRRMRFFMVSRECPEVSESDDDEELSSELDESSQPAAGPGVDSSSIMCCGVDSYMYA